MIHNLRTKFIPKVDVCFNSTVVLLTPVKCASENGQIIRSSEFTPFDIAGSLSPFKSSDFSIVSLEQIGALSTLKTTYMSNMHDMNVADKFDNYKIEFDVQEA